MGSTTTNETKEIVKNDPPSWAQPGLSELGRRITRIIPTMPGPKYTGDFLAQPGGIEQGLPGMYQESADLARSLIQPTMGTMDRSMTMPSFGGPGLEAGTGTFAGYDASSVQPVIQAAIQPLMRQLQEQILPGLQSSGIESGAYGGTRAMETLPGMAIRDASRQAMEVGTGIAFQDYQDQQRRALEAYGLSTTRGLGEADVLTQRLAQYPELIDTVMRMSTGAADLEATAGGLERSHSQAAIDNELAKHDYAVRYPFQGLDVAAALLGNLAAPWGTRSGTSTNTQSTGGLGPIMAGLIGAGSMVAGFPGVSSIFGRGGG